MKPPLGDDPTITPDQATQPAARDSEPALGELPGYQLGMIIGRGGMGEVVAAFDTQMDREVAIKRMRMASPSADAIARFVREAKIQARLDHPAIVPVHELGTDATGNPYFTMKRLAATTLSEAIANGGPSQPLLRAFVDVCFAVERAHSRDVVHRDLKPSNVMLGDFGDVYVIDWGVARVLNTRRTSTVHAVVDTLSPDGTAVGAILGTPGYMAPEQLKGDEIGPAADVYSLGAILFEILAADPLHPPGKPAIASTLAKPTASPAQRKPDRGIAPELDAVCVAALAEDPETRPSARELAERVQRYLDGDRDLERRRALSVEQLAIARAAIGDPAKHGEAAQAASRALALDPESAEAAALVTRMVLEPPVEIPPELARELEATEIELNRQRGRMATKAFLTFFLFMPVFLIMQSVRSVPQLIALNAAAAVMAVLSWQSSRGGSMPTWVLMLGNSALALMFSRLSGSFVLMIALICGQALALATRGTVVRNPLYLVGWVVVTSCAPILLELLGIFERTWHMSAEGLVTHGTIMVTTRPIDILPLTLGQTVLAVVVTVFAMSITRAREEAQRKAAIQAWHMKQLVPRGSR